MLLKGVLGAGSWGSLFASIYNASGDFGAVGGGPVKDFRPPRWGAHGG
jgi:hypothetical protein